MAPLLRILGLGFCVAWVVTSARAQLAVKGALLLADDFHTLPAYTASLQPLTGGWEVKATHPAWHRTEDGLASTWTQGHNPVLFYEAPFHDVVIEVEFRFKQEPGRAAYLRIGPANRELDPRAYTVSAWINVDSRARPPGVILEHEEWRTQGYTSVATRVAEFKPDTWYTARLEVVGDTALVTCNGVTVSGRFPKFSLPKTLFAIGVGHSPHELRHLRVYAATRNPAWREPDPKAEPTTPISALPRIPLQPQTLAAIQAMQPLFDGHSLAGWIQAPVAPTTVDRREIMDVRAFAERLTHPTDPVAAFLSAPLDDAARRALAEATDANARQTLGPALRALNTLLQSGAPLYDPVRFASVPLRPKTQALLAQQPRGEALARLNRLLLEDAFPGVIAQSPDTGWVAKDGVLASTGAGRGVIYTEKDYGSYRLIFQVRQNTGLVFDHFPGVLVFCQRPPAGENGLDALGGIQFGVPSGNHWDYRPGMNNAGRNFVRPLRIACDLRDWAQVEILVDAKKGRVRMAVAQPVGTRPVEILDFEDPAAARSGPIALQMHNARLFDEYRDLRIEENPAAPDRLITLD